MKCLVHYIDNQIKKISIAQSYILKLFLIYTLPDLILQIQVFQTCNVSIIKILGLLLGITTDSLILTSLIILINKTRLRYWLGLIILIVWTFVCFGNVLYFRIFHNYVSLGILSEWKNLFSFGDSVFSLLRWQDILYIFIFFGYLIFIKKRKISTNYLIRVSLIIFSVILMSLFALRTQYFKFTKISNIFSSYSHSVSIYQSGLSAFQIQFFIKNGLIVSYISNYLNISTTKELDSSERAFLNKYIIQTKNTYYKYNKKHNRNLILIMIESFNAEVIGKKVDGIEITPCINKLKKLGYINTNMTAQIQAGISGDGQLIYHTGILPVQSSSGFTLSNYPYNTFIGLSYQLKKHNSNLTSAIIIPTTKDVWNQEQADRQYSIDSLYSIENYEDVMKQKINLIGDKEVFMYAKKITSKMSSKPFFITILTIDTHMPFNKPFKKARIHFSSSCTENIEYQRYLQKCNYVDYYLGDYVSWLAQKNILKNTVLVITADHNVQPYGLKTKSRNIPVIIIGSGISNTEFTKTTIVQADLYPTILDIMNIRNTHWRGVGTSMLLKSEHTNRNIENMEKASHLILQSDYLKTYKNK